MTVLLEYAILGGFAGALAAGGTMVARRCRNPERRERERRRSIHLGGRIGNGTVTDASGDALYYTYTLNGVVYSTSQDIRHLRAYLPTDPACLVGPVTLKYAQRNAANSIVLCEEWSGLRSLTPRTDSPKVLKCS